MIYQYGILYNYHCCVSRYKLTYVWFDYIPEYDQQTNMFELPISGSGELEPEISGSRELEPEISGSGYMETNQNRDSGKQFVLNNIHGWNIHLT